MGITTADWAGMNASSPGAMTHAAIRPSVTSAPDTSTGHGQADLDGARRRIAGFQGVYLPFWRSQMDDTGEQPDA
jgi:hypothetical protein